MDGWKKAGWEGGKEGQTRKTYQIKRLVRDEQPPHTGPHQEAAVSHEIGGKIAIIAI
jgi:hypothetical protein